MKDFFFDTANISFIEKTWDQLKGKVDKSLVRGITTNPNAFAKVEKFPLNEWLEHLPKLCALVTSIREDDKGVVYIQCPNSKMTPDQVLAYAKLVSQHSDGVTKIGLKIPPFEPILRIIPQLNEYVEVNVTGVADASTALKCTSYPLKYVSIIPGRMEEQGINAQSQIEFVLQSNMGDTEIITGSMRTIECLVWTWQIGTVPTIGERVWPLILEGNTLDQLLNIDYSVKFETQNFSPYIDSTNIDLSLSFFQQMDSQGEQAHKDYLTL